MGLLDGHRAIVTGGGSGIGAATARRFAAEGAAVCIFDLDGAAARSVAAEFGGHAFEVNVAATDAVIDATHQAATAMGGLTDVFNNAGVGNLKPLAEYSAKEWQRLVDVNLTGVFNGIKAAMPLLVAEGGGSIVNMASVSGLRPTRGEGPYAAAKAGVIVLSQAAALEYGPAGVRVNTVSPGFIDTPLTRFALDDPAYREPLEAATPLGRAGTAAEVADVVVFLCSDLARYVTGHNLVVDGGSLLPSAQVDHLLGSLLRPAAPAAP
jgi:NAD(P)-dependent dehydrogenase (short-subunit alcohol dehydrogenase family)